MGFILIVSYRRVSAHSSADIRWHWEDDFLEALPSMSNNDRWRQKVTEQEMRVHKYIEGNRQVSSGGHVSEESTANILIGKLQRLKQLNMIEVRASRQGT